jgi:hypothetical protein
MRRSLEKVRKCESTKVGKYKKLKESRCGARAIQDCRRREGLVTTSKQQVNKNYEWRHYEGPLWTYRLTIHELYGCKHRSPY